MPSYQSVQSTRGIRAMRSLLIVSLSVLLPVLLLSCGESEPAEESTDTGADVTEGTVEESAETASEETRMPDQVTASHILVSYQGADRATTTRTREEAETLVEDIAGMISSGEMTFEEAAKEYSDCPSGSRGGALGEFGRGAMVPEFEQAAFGLAVNEVSEAIETSFGFHLILRTE